jgi:uncharacterized protein YndB with AHSA1/START domain
MSADLKQRAREILQQGHLMRYNNTMQKLHASIVINAPREKVWNTMLGKDTYSEWTKAFNPGSTFQGDWTEGSKILFIGVDEQGKNMGGMVSRIAKNVPNEYLSIEHLGMVDAQGVEDTTSEQAKKWAPAFENYTFTEKDGGTELSIDQDMQDEYVTQFEQMWQAALKELKALAEK